ncbi:MAG: hypothetical protein KKG96_07095 [Proteobacteria bacterium]|nr:hypothetical protein [Pseudomonadota bacterium]MBU1965833.1 hypothetical protein [Pseudomonadota bacterium]
MKEMDNRRRRSHQLMIVGLILLVFFGDTLLQGVVGGDTLRQDVPILAAAAIAAETGKIAEMGKFEVVAGSDDKAYLVDKVTGAVWVLTYRTMATGREPIAIPFKFILRTPKNQGEFLVESAGADMSMPPSGAR